MINGHRVGSSRVSGRLFHACTLIFALLLLPAVAAAQRILIDDFPVGIKSGTTTPYTVTLSLTGTSDPAGHSCCVTAPPSLIEVFLIEGDLVLRENQNGSAIPWLDFDRMAVDGNLEFVSQSRATVAGFSNILTVLSGNVTQNGIVGKFTIGADGGLPSGQPIVYNFLAESPTGVGITFPTSSYLAVEATVGIGFQVFDVPVEEEKPEGYYLLMNDGLQATDAEWWLVMIQGAQILSFDINTGTFVPGLRPTYQGPTADIVEPIKFWEFPEPPTEEFTMFFGVDTTQDGVPNESELIGTGYTYYYQ